jgi:hypothetical protein
MTCWQNPTSFNDNGSPTLANIVGSDLPKDRPIDGHDNRPLLRGRKARSPYEFLCYNGRDGQLYALSSGDMKIHFLARDEQRAVSNPCRRHCWTPTRHFLPPALQPAN